MAKCDKTQAGVKIVKYTYQATYEDCSPDGVVRVTAEVLITYSVTWGCPARIHYDEHDHPAEGDELEIEKFELEADSLIFSKGTTWRTPSKEENTILDVWAEKLREDMLFEARETEAEAESEIEARADAEFENRRADLEEWPIG